MQAREWGGEVHTKEAKGAKERKNTWRSWRPWCEKSGRFIHRHFLRVSPFLLCVLPASAVQIGSVPRFWRFPIMAPQRRDERRERSARIGTKKQGLVYPRSSAWSLRRMFRNGFFDH